MRRLAFLALLALFALAFPPDARCVEDAELLRRADSLASYRDSDFSAEYTITEDRPGSARTVTTAGVFRRDARDTFVIVVMSPAANRGQGYLKQGGTLWFYDPQRRRFNTTSSASRFQNTSARNSDFTRSTLAEDYRVTGGADVALGRFRCRLLTLEAVSGEVTYPRMRVWISEDGLVRKTEEYSLSGQLMRTTAIPNYHEVAGRFVPREALIVDALRGATVNGVFVNERTAITVSRPSFARVADYVFSKTFLESVNR